MHLSSNEKFASSLVLTVSNLINTGYTNDLKTGYIKEKIDSEFEKAERTLKEDINLSNSVGSMAAVYANIGPHFHSEVINGVVSNPQGHGLAAEYANDLADKVKHPFRNVTRIGQNNAKNGADRIVGNVKIQTKYLSSARNSVNNAFDRKENGGLYRYKGMQLEVSKDQYNDAIELMKRKISEGKVEGHTNPKDAYRIIRKGSVTWTESKLIAKGGNLTSLKYDALDGVIQTLPVVGISFVIMFAQAKWSGANTKDAALMAAKQGTKVLVMGTIIYAGAQQIAKLLTARLAAQAGRKIAAELIAKRAGMIISFGIVLAPNIFNTLTGRISAQQLLKSTLIVGGGFLGGVGASAGAGALLGSFVPGAGNAVGAVIGAGAVIIGGIAGTIGSKKILDNFIEDDRVEMFAQLKEEYLDVVMSISLTDSEFSKVQELVFDKSLQSKLKDMFKADKKIGSRAYARENIVEMAIEGVIQQRTSIEDIEIIDGISNLPNKFASV